LGGGIGAPQRRDLRALQAGNGFPIRWRQVRHLRLPLFEERPKTAGPVLLGRLEGLTDQGGVAGLEV